VVEGSGRASQLEWSQILAASNTRFDRGIGRDLWKRELTGDRQKKGTILGIKPPEKEMRD